MGISGQNDIWVLVPWLGTKYIIRGKVMVPPKSDIWVLVPWLGTKYIIRGKVMVPPKSGPW